MDGGGEGAVAEADSDRVCVVCLLNGAEERAVGGESEGIAAVEDGHGGESLEADDGAVGASVEAVGKGGADSFEVRLKGLELRAAGGDLAAGVLTEDTGLQVREAAGLGIEVVL